MTREHPTTADNIARHDKAFQAACERAGVKATKRQAAKYRRGYGSAFAHRQSDA